MITLVDMPEFCIRFAFSIFFCLFKFAVLSNKDSLPLFGKSVLVGMYVYLFLFHNSLSAIVFLVISWQNCGFFIVEDAISLHRVHSRSLQPSVVSRALKRSLAL